MPKIQRNDVVRFIKTRLPRNLRNDFARKPYRMFRERDLHCCAYYHLRRFLAGDHTWSVLNEPHLRNLFGRAKHGRPDIVLFHRGVPRFLIELKFREKRVGIGTKDSKVLRFATRHTAWADKAYYVETVISPEKHSSKSVSKYRNAVLSIVMPDKKRNSYLRKFRQFRKPTRRH